MAKSLRILVVVDDRDVGEGLSEVLEMAGHEVTLALNADSAKSLLEEQTYDIGFFNVRLPGKGGVETFVALRRLQPSLEAIMMTGSTTEQLLAEIVVEGRASTLHLPLDFDSLKKSLDHAMPRGIVLIPSNGAQLSDNLGDHLRDEGRDAAVARSEGEAMELLERKPDRTIILDLQVSVVAALSVYLKVMEGGYAKPLIIVGRPPIAGSDTSVPFRDLWVTGVLFKPFDPRKLLSALEQDLLASMPAPMAAEPGLPPEQESVEEAKEEPDHHGQTADTAPAPTIFQLPTTLLKAGAGNKTQAPSGADDLEGLGEPENPGDLAVLEEPDAPEDFNESEDSIQAEEAGGPKPETSQTGPSSSADQGRVLVVDDDREMAEGISELLEARGYETAKAYSFDEALESLRGFAAQVALIDVQIGGSSGLDLIPLLQAEQPLLVPVMLTARADKDTVVAALRSGAYDYLTKPFDPAELFTALDRSFSRLRSTGDGTEALLAKISYGMRTPLNAVVGFSEILKNELLGPIGSDKYVGYAEDINTAGREISGMLGTMLDPADSYGPERPADNDPPAEVSSDLEDPLDDAPKEGGVPATDGNRATDRTASEIPVARPQRFEVPSLKDIKSGRDSAFSAADVSEGSAPSDGPTADPQAV